MWVRPARFVVAILIGVAGCSSPSRPVRHPAVAPPDRQHRVLLDQAQAMAVEDARAIRP